MEVCWIFTDRTLPHRENYDAALNYPLSLEDIV